MIAKRVTSEKPRARAASLVKYVVAAEGSVDPRSWTRTADYMLASKTNEYGEKVGGVRVTNCYTDDPAVATTLIEATQAENTTSKSDKTYHLIFSFPPGENPDLTTLHKIEDELVASIGFAEHQRISAVHIDTDHLHVHIAINKVHPKSFNNFEPYYDKLKLMETCERLEIEYGLERTNHGLTGEKTKAERLTERNALAPNHIRLYRGEGGQHTGSVKGGNWWTTSPEKASKFGKVVYVDLPTSFVGNNFAQGHNGSDEFVFAGSDDSWKRNIRSLDSIPSKQATAEAHSGMETLTGYVAREVAGAAYTAKDWNELHNIFAKHGLQIKKRGAGLVIGNGDKWVRASQCDRALSMKALTDRLGEFKQSVHPASKAYTPRPTQTHQSTSRLYERYQQERQSRLAARGNALSEIQHEREALNAQLQRWRFAQRALVKATLRGSTRRAALQMIRIQTGVARTNNKRAIQAKRNGIMSATATPSWVEWLAHQAQNGNSEALAVLRSREGYTVPGNTLSPSAKTTGKNGILTKLNPRIDKNGRATYRTADGGIVIDRQNQVQSYKTTSEATLIALELASKRFTGKPLIVEGQEEFKREVARLAGQQGLQVRFADPAMEKARQASLKPRQRGKSNDRGMEL